MRPLSTKVEGALRVLRHQRTGPKTLEAQREALRYLLSLRSFRGSKARDAWITASATLDELSETESTSTRHAKRWAQVRDRASSVATSRTRSTEKTGREREKPAAPAIRSSSKARPSRALSALEKAKAEKAAAVKKKKSSAKGKKKRPAPKPVKKSAKKPAKKSATSSDATRRPAKPKATAKKRAKKSARKPAKRPSKKSAKKPTRKPTKRPAKRKKSVREDLQEKVQLHLELDPSLRRIVTDQEIGELAAMEWYRRLVFAREIESKGYGPEDIPYFEVVLEGRGGLAVTIKIERMLTDENVAEIMHDLRPAMAMLKKYGRFPYMFATIDTMENMPVGYPTGEEFVDPNFGAMMANVHTVRSAPVADHAFEDAIEDKLYDIVEAIDKNRHGFVIVHEITLRVLREPEDE